MYIIECGHPKIESGYGTTLKDALYDFMETNKSDKGGFTLAMNSPLDGDFIKYIDDNGAEDAFRKIQESRNYNPIVLIKK